MITAMMNSVAKNPNETIKPIAESATSSVFLIGRPIQIGSYVSPPYFGFYYKIFPS